MVVLAAVEVVEVLPVSVVPLLDVASRFAGAQAALSATIATTAIRFLITDKSSFAILRRASYHC